MPMMPFQILGIWFRGLLSIALLGAGIYLLRQWYEEGRPRVVERPVVAADVRDDAARDRAGAPGGGEVVRRELQRPT